MFSSLSCSFVETLNISRSVPLHLQLRQRNEVESDINWMASNAPSILVLINQSLFYLASDWSDHYLREEKMLTHEPSSFHPHAKKRRRVESIGSPDI